MTSLLFERGTNHAVTQSSTQEGLFLTVVLQGIVSEQVSLQPYSVQSPPFSVLYNLQTYMHTSGFYSMFLVRSPNFWLNNVLPDSENQFSLQPSTVVRFVRIWQNSEKQTKIGAPHLMCEVIGVWCLENIFEKGTLMLNSPKHTPDVPWESPLSPTSHFTHVHSNLGAEDEGQGRVLSPRVGLQAKHILCQPKHCTPHVAPIRKHFTFWEPSVFGSMSYGLLHSSGIYATSCNHACTHNAR